MTTVRIAHKRIETTVQSILRTQGMSPGERGWAATQVIIQELNKSYSKIHEGDTSHPDYLPPLAPTHQSQIVVNLGNAVRKVVSSIDIAQVPADTISGGRITLKPSVKENWWVRFKASREKRKAIRNASLGD